MNCPPGAAYPREKYVLWSSIPAMRKRGEMVWFAMLPSFPPLALVPPKRSIVELSAWENYSNRLNDKRSPAEIALMQTADKGEVSVKVQVTDATGIEPLECEMIWAWVPKK